jgi:hypothetical protein
MAAIMRRLALAASGTLAAIFAARGDQRDARQYISQARQE